MSKVRPDPPHPFFITHPELSFEDALAYASDLLQCAEALGDSPKTASYLVDSESFIRTPANL